MSEQTESQTSQASESNQQQQVAASAPQASEFSIPEAYKGKGWAEKIKTPDDVWKSLDSAQSMLGKRPAGIPALEASAEEWTKFAEALRPKSADDYGLGAVEGLPEGFDVAPYKEKAQKLMHEAGLDKRQADALWKQYMAAEMTSASERNAARDKEYDEGMAKLFGDKAADAATAAQEIIKATVPEELRAGFANLKNEPQAMVAVIKALTAMQDEVARVKKEYGVEGGLPGETPPADGKSMDEMVKEQAKLRLSKAFSDPLHVEHRKTNDEINRLDEVIKKHYNRA